MMKLSIALLAFLAAFVASSPTGPKQQMCSWENTKCRNYKDCCDGLVCFNVSFCSVTDFVKAYNCWQYADIVPNYR